MLGFVILMGLAGAYTAQLARALPWIGERVRRGVRPWACNVCMAFWSSLIYAGLPMAARGAPGILDVLAVPAASGVALIVLTWLDAKAPPLPPELP